MLRAPPQNHVAVFFMLALNERERLIEAPRLVRWNAVQRQIGVRDAKPFDARFLHELRKKRMRVEILIKHGVAPSRIKFISLVAAPEGVTVFNEKFSNIPIYTASLDEKLNEKAYIVPGLGDAGDRLFGTL